MRLDGPEDMLALATLIHEHHYPKSIIPDNPTMTECIGATPSCVKREYVFQSERKHYCRAPSQYCPDELQPAEDCPRRHYDAKRSLAPQRSKPGATMPRIKGGDRRDRRIERLKRWVTGELQTLSEPGMSCCVAASVYLHDLDVSLTWVELDELGGRLWHSYAMLPREMR